MGWASDPIQSRSMDPNQSAGKPITCCCSSPCLACGAVDLGTPKTRFGSSRSLSINPLRGCSRSARRPRSARRRGGGRRGDGGAGLMAEQDSAVRGGGVMAEQDSAVLGGGGMAEQDSAVLGGGGMAEQDSTVLGGGGIAEPERAVPRATVGELSPAGINTRSSSGQPSTERLSALAPSSIHLCCF